MRPLLLDPQLESAAATLLLTATFCSCLYYHGRKCIIHVGFTFWPNFFNCWQVSQLYVVEQLKFLHLQNTRMTRNQVTYKANILANCKYYYTKYIIMQRISKSTLWNSTLDHLPNKRFRTIPIFEQTFFFLQKVRFGWIRLCDRLSRAVSFTRICKWGKTSSKSTNT